MPEEAPVPLGAIPTHEKRELRTASQFNTEGKDIPRKGARRHQEHRRTYN